MRDGGITTLSRSAFVEFSACGLVDEVGLLGLMRTEPCGHDAEPVSDTRGIDLDGRVGFDLFSQGRDGDREIEQFLLNLLDLRDVFGVGERDLVQQADRTVGARELCPQRGVEGVDSDRHPVKPCAIPAGCGRNECIFDDVQSPQRGLTFCADVSRESVERASSSGRLGHG